jgi:hypothetical protein
MRRRRTEASRQRRGGVPALITLLLLIPLIGMGIVAGRSTAQASSGLLPDLAMAPLQDFRIEAVNGRRLLRFTAMMVNVGPGHFELRGSRSSTSQPMRMSQVVFTGSARTAPIATQTPTDAVASFAGDGHNHWHVDEMMRYDMWGTGGNFKGAKVGFCFLDSDPWATGLPGYSGSYYRGTMCGTNPGALSNRMGISIGWGDEYEHYLAWQWVDITGVPAGTYYVRATVDPYGFFAETDDTNQCAWARVRFGASSTALAVETSGRTCINDIDASIFANDIRWAFDRGITVGCAPNLFCTSNAVTREQMASFLARGLGLPAASGDYFADDSASAHQEDINRVAEAGITVGCRPDRYCPKATVTRDQMASFLKRALALPPTDEDYFEDDEFSTHEGDINRMAAAGVTGGCDATRFCPSAPVTRGQMAAFLHRGLE